MSSSSQPYMGQELVHLGNGASLEIAKMGNGKIDSPIRSLTIKTILHCPSLSKSLLSIHKFAYDNNCYFVFYPFHVFVKDQATQNVLLQGVHDHSLYKIGSTPLLHMT